MAVVSKVHTFPTAQNEVLQFSLGCFVHVHWWFDNFLLAMSTAVVPTTKNFLAD